MEREVWENARSIEQIPEEERKSLVRIGEVRKGSRVYVFYQTDASKYWYRTEIIKDGRRMTEQEAIFGKVIRRKAYHR